MRRVALKGLWWRRGRAVLTACAVVLGVAMVSGTFILTDTINKAFDTIFQDSYSKTSAVISGREVVKDAASGNATVPASLLERVRADSNVAAATGAVFNLSGTPDPTQLIGKNGQRLGSSQNGQFGFGFDPNAERFNPLSLTAGRWASGPGQVVIDKGTATDNDYAVGDRGCPEVRRSLRRSSRPVRSCWERSWSPNQVRLGQEDRHEEGIQPAGRHDLGGVGVAAACGDSGSAG
jgi:putative ABC transport system permease protein